MHQNYYGCSIMFEELLNWEAGSQLSITLVNSKPQMHIVNNLF